MAVFTEIYIFQVRCRTGHKCRKRKKLPFSFKAATPAAEINASKNVVRDRSKITTPSTGNRVENLIMVK